MSSKNKKGKGGNDKPDTSQKSQPPVQNAIPIETLSLKPVEVQSEFDFNSQLFLTYLRSSLSQLTNIQVGETLTIQVFGENEKFIVTQLKVKGDEVQVDGNNQTEETKVDGNNTNINKIVTKDTQITIKQLNDDSEEEEEDANEIDALEQMFREMTLKESSHQTQFGGFREQLELLKEVIDIRLFRDSIEGKSVKIKGILVHGPSGIGKTMAVESVLSQYQQMHKIIITPKHLIQSTNGPIKKLQDAFKLAKLRQPSILVIEELDYIASSKAQSSKDLFYSFLSELDLIDTLSNKILVIATTNKLEEIDKSLRRGGRLDIDIRFDMPSAEDRFEILKAHLNMITNEQNNELSLAQQITENELQIIARAASGFVSSDLAQIVRNAHLKSLKINQGVLSKQILEQAIMEAKPLSIQDLIVEVPKTRWDEIGGNEEIKFQVKQCVEWPLKHHNKFELMGLKPPAGILLYGPPGCSKTMIAKALATESGLNFIAIKGPELFSKYVGDTEKAIREIFRKARLSSPSIIFFDEIDAMATQRGNEETSVSDRALTQLLNEMDGIESRAQVIVVAATNRLDIIDTALLRPGRFDRLIYVPLPTVQAREQILRINLSRMQRSDDIDYAGLGAKTEGMSGAEITLICREAGLKALTEDMNIEKDDIDSIKITNKHLEQAFMEVKERGKADKKQSPFQEASLFTK